MSQRIRVLLWIAAAACGGESSPASKESPKAADPPAAPPQPLTKPAGPEPAPAAKVTEVVGTSSSGSPACGTVHEFEREHWDGDRKPEWRDNRLYGCHFLATQTDNLACWNLDIEAARYEMTSRDTKLGGVGEWRHEQADKSVVISPSEVYARKDEPPTGFKATTEKHGDIKVTAAPEKGITLCKGTRCTKHDGETAVLPEDWSLLLAVGNDAIAAIDVATGKELYKIPLLQMSRGNPTFHGATVLVNTGTGTQVIDAYSVHDAKTGAKLCALGKTGWEVAQRYEISPTRWVLRLEPIIPEPKTQNYEDQVVFQDPISCKVLQTIPSPVARESNITIMPGVNGHARFHPVLLPAGGDRYILAYAGGSAALIDAAAMTITKVIRPPACTK